MLNPGMILQGRYRILQWLGGGGMGAVYLAVDLRLVGRQVAIKQLVPEPGASPTELAQIAGQFQAEATLLATLAHSNLPKVHDYFVEMGQSFLVMDYVEGGTLQSIIEHASNHLSEKLVLDWAVQICDVLTYLHSQHPPVIFRDLKPANVMLDRQGKIKLIDFGIARVFKRGKQTDTLRMGTLGYAPPEQYAGRGQTDVRSDVYSLGATLHHLLTGRDPSQNPPFSFQTAPPRSLNSALSVETEAAVMKALEHNPGDRFQSAAEMKNALLRKSAPAKKRRIPVIAVILMLLVVAGTYVTMQLDGLGAMPVRPLPATKPVAVVSVITPVTPTAVIAPTEYPVDVPTLSPLSTAESTPYPVGEETGSLPKDEAIGSLGRIAFYSGRDGNDEIYIMEGDGGYQRRLTYHPASDQYPMLSPDGLRIAFVSNRDGNSEIYVINSDGSGETRLTFHNGEDRLPAWSPDGSKIAFNSDRNGNLDIYVMDVNGSALAQISSGPARDGHVTWSPDGRSLAFNSGMSKEGWEIYMMPVTGGNWRRLTNNSIMDWSPNWSSIDGHVMYLSFQSGRTKIMTIDVDTGVTREIPTHLNNVWGAAWSPDGLRIVLTSDESGRNEIYSMSDNGSGITQLTFDGGAYPSWSW